MSKAMETSNESLVGYHHHFHAGNVGDVWKHSILFSLLSQMTQSDTPIHALECHSGSGRYVLASTGEWTEGIGRLCTADLNGAPQALRRYVDLITDAGFAPPSKRVYLGSPLLMGALLRVTDRLDCYELDASAAQNLRHYVGDDGRFTVHQEDGIAAMLRFASQPHDAQCLVHIDPPWNEKRDWQEIPAAMVKAQALMPSAIFALWYPIKSYTRVAAMLKQLQAARLSAVALDLITTPLEHRRNRLNGSGMLVVNAPHAVIADAAAMAVYIARACSTHNGYYQLQVTHW